MKKEHETLFSRIAIFNEGRRAYVAFVANMAAQALLLGIAMAGLNRVLTDGLSRNPNALVMALVLAAGLLCLVWANAAQFFTDCYGSRLGKWVRRVRTRYQTGGLPRYLVPLRVSCALWRRKRVEVMEFLLVWVFTVYCFFGVVVQGAVILNAIANISAPPAATQAPAKAQPPVYPSASKR